MSESLCRDPILGTCPPFPADFSELLERFVRIGAPTGGEEKRAAFVVDWFEALRPGSAVRDGLNNVIVDLSGGASGLWLLDAHLDIVFDDASPLLARDGSIWNCPGIIDDSLCCVLLMLFGRQILETNLQAPLILSFSVGEEGEGNLKGILAVGQLLKERLRGAWALDGGLDRATAVASGSKRWKLMWNCAGGHSWNHFGRPSAIHAMCEWIASIGPLAEWKPFHLTYTIGRISGGSTINSIAAHGECFLDLRSVDPEALAKASDTLLAKAREIGARHEVRVEWESVGGRPASPMLPKPKILDWLEEIHRQLDLPFQLVVNSTNANGLLSLGIPATSTGLGRGDKIHTREEWLDLTTVPLGWKKLWLMAERACAPEGE